MLLDKLQGNSLAATYLSILVICSILKRNSNLNMSAFMLVKVYWETSANMDCYAMTSHFIQL